VVLEESPPFVWRCRMIESIELPWKLGTTTCAEESGKGEKRLSKFTQCNNVNLQVKEETTFFNLKGRYRKWLHACRKPHENRSICCEATVGVLEDLGLFWVKEILWDSCKPAE